jgi:molecular chaperone DnaK
VDKALSEYGDQMPTEDKAAVETANADLKEALKADDVDAIKAKTDELMRAFQKAGQAVQQSQAAAGTPGASEPSPEEPAAGGDEVVEGEIVEEGGAS